MVLLLARFYVVRVKFLRLLMISPSQPTHQSLTAGSVWLVMGNGEVNARMVRLNKGARKTRR